MISFNVSKATLATDVRLSLRDDSNTKKISLLVKYASLITLLRCEDVEDVEDVEYHIPCTDVFLKTYDTIDDNFVNDSGMSDVIFKQPGDVFQPLSEYKLIWEQYIGYHIRIVDLNTCIGVLFKRLKYQESKMSDRLRKSFKDQLLSEGKDTAILDSKDSTPFKKYLLSKRGDDGSLTYGKKVSCFTQKDYNIEDTDKKEIMEYFVNVSGRRFRLSRKNSVPSIVRNMKISGCESFISPNVFEKRYIIDSVVETFDDRDKGEFYYDLVKKIRETPSLDFT